ADGSGEERLTFDPGMDGFCWNEWSPDGKTILFDTNRDGTYQVYRMNADGGQKIGLSPKGAPAEGPAWSPDGRFVVFTSRFEGNWEIYKVKADGSGLRKLTSNRAVDFNPFWSPDGSRIAFISDRAGHNEIFTMRPDGSRQTRLTRGLEDKGRDRHRWSPDGTRIAYVAYTGKKEDPSASASGLGFRQQFSPSDD
ncbi:MAG TPA: hypothetical protein VLB09_02785, partial [Nitrospiria bacterium]|nr:hypothetical protein [Nitrospiria bacterium]